MSKTNGRLASAESTPTVAVHPAWCNAISCDTNGVHESTEQVLDATIGRISTFLGQELDGPEDTFVVLTADQFPAEGVCPDFMQMTLEQAEQLRDALSALLAVAKPAKRAASCWADTNTKRVTAAVR